MNQNEENPFVQSGWRDGKLETCHDIKRFAGIPTFIKAPLLELQENPTVGIVGVPYDGGIVRTPGTRFGPREIRNACWRVNEFNPEIGVNPYAIHNIVDCGDLVLSPLSISDTFESIQKGICHLLDRNIIPVSVGGDHFITHPILKSIADKHGTVACIHFDAHTDTADEGFGQKLNHGTMFRRGIEEQLICGSDLIQVGIRKIYHDRELDYHQEHGIEVISSRDLRNMQPDLRGKFAEHLARLKGKKVYVTFDIDFIDPAYAPGTGSPEVAGPTSDEALECIRALQGLDIVGFDLVEVSPLMTRAA